MISEIVANIISKNHCFLINPTTAFQSVFIRDEEIVVFMCNTNYQKDTDHLLLDYQLFKKLMCPKMHKVRDLFPKLGRLAS
jgi:hypothetical protein